MLFRQSLGIDNNKIAMDVTQPEYRNALLKLKLLQPKAISDEEHSESEFYYPDKIEFNENIEEKEKSAVINRE